MLTMILLSRMQAVPEEGASRGPTLPVRASALLIGLALLSAARGARCEGVAFTLRPEIGVQAGVESFELSATVPVQGIEVTAASKLSYSAATALAGGTLRLDLGILSLGGTILTNLVDPWGTVLDQDFLSAGTGEVIEFSHTDSRITLRAIVVEGVAPLRVAELAPLPRETTLPAL